MISKKSRRRRKEGLFEDWCNEERKSRKCWASSTCRKNCKLRWLRSPKSWSNSRWPNHWRRSFSTRLCWWFWRAACGLNAGQFDFWICRSRISKWLFEVNRNVGLRRFISFTCQETFWKWRLGCEFPNNFSLNWWFGLDNLKQKDLVWRRWRVKNACLWFLRKSVDQ